MFLPNFPHIRTLLRTIGPIKPMTEIMPTMFTISEAGEDDRRVMIPVPPMNDVVNNVLVVSCVVANVTVVVMKDVDVDVLVNPAK